ncbi:MAG: DUF3108 domain-containing protein [Mariprofundus sp.]
MADSCTTRPLLGILLLLTIWLPCSAAAEPKTDCMPYIGEHMSFNVDWEFINAGSATMDIVPMAHGWRVKTFARTNKVLDIFKKVRDHITAEGICMHGKMQSTLFDANLQERKYMAQKRTEFLWRKNKVRYTQHDVAEYFDVKAGHLSVIDAFLAVRKLKLVAGKTVSIPIFDSRKKYEIQVNIMAKKAILKAPWGEKIRCIVVKPKLKTEGIFASKGEMTLWMTDDQRHIPIKMMAKIKFGHIFARLTSYTSNSIR